MTWRLGQVGVWELGQALLCIRHNGSAYVVLMYQMFVFPESCVCGGGGGGRAREGGGRVAEGLRSSVLGGCTAGKLLHCRRYGWAQVYLLDTRFYGSVVYYWGLLLGFTARVGYYS